MEWHQLSPAQAVKELGSDDRGLTDIEASNRLSSYGRNKLSDARPDSVLVIFFRQFASPIIYILLFAALVVLALGHFTDAIIILAVLFINAIVGAIQEGKAQNTLAALRNIMRTNATVSRGGREIIVSSEEVVPGDIVVLKEGDKVPADGRILEVHDLKVDEAALTGESEPVMKSVDEMQAKEIPSADKKNMVWSGTYVVGGDARAAVVSTGIKTLIGGISEKLSRLDTDVPLKASIRALSKKVIMGVLSICALIFFIGLVRGVPLADMFVTAVAVAVSATPEGLPVVVTIILAAGMYRMSKQNALVRKLQAVEALGQAQVIAVDKTGTITLNQMAVEKLYVNGKVYDIEASGYAPEGSILYKGKPIEAVDHPDILLAGKIAAFTAGANVAYDEKSKEWQRTSGDPTEAALLVLSRKMGFAKDILEQEHRRLSDMPFSSGTKYHAALHEMDGKVAFSVIGAPETILESSTEIWESGKSVTLTKRHKEEIENAILSLSRQGLRLVALAIRFNNGLSVTQGKLPELCFVGFVGISDSIRADARAALDKAHSAGVRIVMITGDYPETAKAIAHKVGIWNEGDEVITGKQLSSLSEVELIHLLPKTTVFARVAPEDKLKIIDAYRKHGEVIAMTGDGVNDALSLAAADLGVAMGKIGTEVAKEAADIVLLDDNFGNIVSAIEEGRNVYRSIKKVILYLFSTSVGEILTITIAMLAGLPIPLLASQIIWMNFVTDGFLVVALALEPKERNLLLPSKKRNDLIDNFMLRRVGLISLTMAVCALVLFYSYLGEGFVKASTVALTTLAVCQWFNAFNCRTERHSIFRLGRFGNPYLLGALAIVIILQILAVYAAPLQAILHTTALNIDDWMVIIGTSLLIIVVEEIRKAISRI